MGYFKIPLQDASAALLDWTAANPGHAALYVVEGVAGAVIIFNPAAITLPFLGAIGWGPLSPIAGSVAASLQTSLTPIGATGFFATCQSAAMGGYGVAIVNGVAQGTAAVVGAGPYLVRAATAWWYRTP